MTASTEITSKIRVGRRLFTGVEGMCQKCRPRAVFPDGNKATLVNNREKVIKLGFDEWTRPVNPPAVDFDQFYEGISPPG